MVFCSMKKAENFFKALQNLKEIEGKKPPYDTIAMAGMVSLFEICFEQAWKAMKEQLEASGYGEYKSGSPRSVIKLAYQARMVKDEELWLAALQARNTSQSRFPSFVTVKRSSLRCLSSWRRSCGRVGFDGSLTFINFQDICSAVTQNGMSCFGARSSQQFHQRGMLYICPHVLTEV